MFNRIIKYVLAVLPFTLIFVFSFFKDGNAHIQGWVIFFFTMLLIGNVLSEGKWPLCLFKRNRNLPLSSTWPRTEKINQVSIIEED